MNEKHRIILEILAKATTPLTIAEIRAEMEPSELGLIGNGSDTSKIAEYLCRVKNYIENGPTEYPGGKSRLTWKITKTGLDALTPFNPHEGPITPVVENVDLGYKPYDDEIAQLTDVDTLENNMLHLAIAADDPLEMAFFNLIMQLRDINPAPSIANKTAKIKVLGLLEEFPVIDNDTRQVIADIKTDLQQLDEAA